MLCVSYLHRSCVIAKARVLRDAPWTSRRWTCNVIWGSTRISFCSCSLAAVSQSIWLMVSCEETNYLFPWPQTHWGSLKTPVTCAQLVISDDSLLRRNVQRFIKDTPSSEFVNNQRSDGFIDGSNRRVVAVLTQWCCGSCKITGMLLWTRIFSLLGCSRRSQDEQELQSRQFDTWRAGRKAESAKSVNVLLNMGVQEFHTCTVSRNLHPLHHHQPQTTSGCLSMKNQANWPDMLTLVAPPFGLLVPRANVP